MRMRGRAAVFGGMVGVLLFCGGADAQEGMRAEPLWPSAAPGALGDSVRDQPSITPYPAAEAERTGAGVVVFPGGGAADGTRGRIRGFGRATCTSWL